MRIKAFLITLICCTSFHANTIANIRYPKYRITSIEQDTYWYMIIAKKQRSYYAILSLNDTNAVSDTCEKLQVGKSYRLGDLVELYPSSPIKKALEKDSNCLYLRFWVSNEYDYKIYEATNLNGLYISKNKRSSNDIYSHYNCFLEHQSFTPVRLDPYRWVCLNAYHPMTKDTCFPMSYTSNFKSSFWGRLFAKKPKYTEEFSPRFRRFSLTRLFPKKIKQLNLYSNTDSNTFPYPHELVNIGNDILSENDSCPYLIIKIIQDKNFDIILAKKNNQYFQILSSKNATHYSDTCQRLREGGYYELNLLSVFPISQISMKLDTNDNRVLEEAQSSICSDYIEFEDSTQNRLYVALNLEGLYITPKTKESSEIFKQYWRIIPVWKDIEQRLLGGVLIFSRKK